MKLYTLAEIMEDVEKFEGVSLALSVVSEKRQVLFFRLYSEAFQEPLDDPNDKDSLQSRITNFIQGPFSFINVDVPPSAEMKAWIIYEVLFDSESDQRDRIQETRYLGMANTYEGLTNEWTVPHLLNMGIRTFLVFNQTFKESQMFRIMTDEEIEVNSQMQRAATHPAPTMRQ